MTKKLKVIAAVVAVLVTLTALGIQIEKYRFERCAPEDFRSRLQGCEKAKEK
jgi:hypothetical protein